MSIKKYADSTGLTEFWNKVKEQSVSLVISDTEPEVSRDYIWIEESTGIVRYAKTITINNEESLEWTEIRSIWG